MTDTQTLVTRARRDLNAMRSFVRAKGLTGWVKNRSAGGQYQRAFESLVRVEDALGVEHATTVRLGDRLRGLYDEARRNGLLSDSEILAAERKAVANVDRERERAAARNANV